ncbi:MAG: GNAT family N-acetyltransferase [Novosphingobium sp. 28-62-57]|uniref:GNAT family N-acetyltransferase n=1 Tax=unclassified Novosphingobium TaxID=2644732 RepID=UPI000BCA69DA|nr:MULTISPECIES: GNAT family N-acetyltransferase [unclassified Novosphingobium]OYW50440.1 MAG: GNAT family N-acetyltransferase [Novosphingobium sp. 12-62-10]OYZ11457.1 MAG: GNAT family N-acetyltransferase [Novosphingobium sp. 28-62-57]
MPDIVITHMDQGARGEYHAAVAGSEAIGRLTYQRNGDVVVADHTLVPSAIGGRGVAAELVKALIADARAQGFRIVPQCSYVEAAFRWHPEWADLRA